LVGERRLPSLWGDRTFRIGEGGKRGGKGGVR
jgi:hypothetical protein